MTKRFPLPRRALILACASFLIAANPCARGQEASGGFSKEKLERIPALLTEKVEKKALAGASALIARQGKVVQLSTAGMQDVEGKVPMTDATIFRIASMSKPIISVAVMTLVDDGILSVTDPLS